MEKFIAGVRVKRIGEPGDLIPMQLHITFDFDDDTHFCVMFNTNESATIVQRKLKDIAEYIYRKRDIGKY